MNLAKSSGVKPRIAREYSAEAAAAWVQFIVQQFVLPLVRAEFYVMPGVPPRYMRHAAWFEVTRCANATYAAQFLDQVEGGGGGEDADRLRWAPKASCGLRPIVSGGAAGDDAAHRPVDRGRSV